MSTRRRHLLVVTPHAPWPDNHGFAIRLRNHIERISERHDVSLFCFIGGTDDPALSVASARYCRHVHLQQRGMSTASGGIPQGARPYLEPHIRDRLNAIVRTNDFDLVQVESTDLAGLIDPAWNVPTVVVAHDISIETEFRRWRSQSLHGFGSEAPRTIRDLLRVWRYERRGLAAAAEIHCMSGRNRRRLALLSPSLVLKSSVVPNGVDTRRFVPDGRAERDGILFLGSFSHPPNLDALDVLVKDIWPEVMRQRPDSRLTIAGASPPKSVLNLSRHDGVSVLGEVSDPVPLFQSHVALAVPLRAGSGTRIKILESLSCGLPVVSTRIGAEGIAAPAKSGIFLAESPRKFANLLIRLLEDPALVKRSGAAGRIAAVDRFDWSSSVSAAMASYERTLSGVNAQRDSIRREESPEGGPLVEVLVPIRPGAKFSSESLRAARNQSSIHHVRWTVVGEESSLRDVQCEGFGRAVVKLAGGCDRESAVAVYLNRAIATSDARLVALLEPGETPAVPTWLDNLVWCLLQPNAPAAVQGERVPPGGVPAERDLVAPRGAWPFSFANSALPVALARSFPFAAAPDAAQRWVTMIEARGLFVLSTPDAPVTRASSLGAE